MIIREWRATDRVSDLTQLVNDAYASLAAQGLRFLGTHQDDETTADRMSRATTFVLEDDQGKLVGTVSLENRASSLKTKEKFYAQEHTRVLSQLGVLPHLRNSGWGRKLVEHVETKAREQGAKKIMLDTAMPAAELRAWYQKLGYRELHEVQWDGPNYRSVVLAKPLVDNQISVRFVAERDIPQVIEAIRLTFDEFGFTWEADGYCRDLYELPHSYPRPDNYFWVAEVNGEVLGTVGISRHANQGEEVELHHDPQPGQSRVHGTDCELHRLYVHPRGRGTGLGKILLETALHQALADGCHAMEIWSDVKLTRAHEIYRKIGAIEVGKRILDDPDESLECGFGLPLS